MYLVLFSFIGLVVSSALNCPSSAWLRFRQKCYLGDVSKFYSFEENLAFCKAHNATSVSIHSAEENSFLKSNLITGRAYWLGIKQISFNSGAYQWLDGSVYNYNKWTRRDGAKACVGAFMQDGEWEDRNKCDDTWRAFCQIVLEPSEFNMPSQIVLRLEHKTNQTEIQMNLIQEDLLVLKQTINESINSRIEDATIRQGAMMTNLSSTFDSEMMKKEIQFNNSLVELTLLFRNMQQTISEIKLENKNVTVVSVEKWNLCLTIFLLNGATMLATLAMVIYFIISRRKRRQSVTDEIDQTNAVLFIKNSSFDNLLQC